MNKKFFALLMAVVLVIGMLPATVLADTSDACIAGDKHTIKEVEAVAATCDTEGNIAYSYCTKCEWYWNEAGEKIQLKDTIIDALGHTYVGEINQTNKDQCRQFCSTCEKTIVDKHDDCWCEIEWKEYHKPEYVEAYAGNCAKDKVAIGAYWQCSVCDAIFADEACTQLTNIKNVTIGIVHDLKHVPAVADSCEQEGNVEYWYCADCKGIWADADCTIAIDTIEDTVLPQHNLTKVKPSAATCTEAGSDYTYYHCEDCGKNYTDETATTEFTKIYPAKGHSVIKYTNAKAPSCTETGRIDSWQCTECKKIFADEKCTTEATEVVLDMVAHTIVHVEAKKPTCTEHGYSEFWYCSCCLAAWSKEDLSEESAIMGAQRMCFIWKMDKDYNLVLDENGNPIIADYAYQYVAENGHDWKYVGSKYYCEMEGNEGHYVCKTCGALSQKDKNGEYVAVKAEDLVTKPTGHADLVLFKGRKATCTKDGWSTCYYCPNCLKAWTDAEGKNPILGVAVKEDAEGNLVCLYEYQVAAHMAEGYVNNGENHTWYCTQCKKSKVQDHDFTNGNCVCGAEHVHAWVEHEAVEPTCTTAGNIAYKQCSLCGEAWTLGENPIPLSKDGWVLGVKHGEIVKVEAVEPTCDTEGNIGYWYCKDCGYHESEDGMPLAKDRWVLAAKGHAWVDHAAVAPTCSSEGNIAYKQCSVCGAAQTAGENPLPLGKDGWILGPSAHDLVHVEAKAPTAEAEGNIEHWYCKVCETVWQDAALTQITNHKNVIIAKLDAPAASEPEASKPEESKPADTTKPSAPSEDEPSKTGDEVQIALMGTMMVLAVLAMAAVVLMKKSSFTGRFTK